jgi:hypothetical protein
VVIPDQGDRVTERAKPGFKTWFITERQVRGHAEMAAVMESRSGDPEATRAAILQVVDSESPPLRLLLGDGTVSMLATAYESRLAVWRSWEAVSVAAQGSLRS